MRPSQIGIDYLLPIFTNAVGADDVEVLRTDLFDPSHLTMPYHSVNTDVNKRIRYLESRAVDAREPATTAGLRAPLLDPTLDACVMRSSAAVLCRMNAAPAPRSRRPLKIERRSSHPWIFQKMVEKPADAAAAAARVVDILDRDGQWVGRGFYNGHSRIALRILTADPDEADRRRLLRPQDRRARSRFRRDVLKLDEVTDAYRLVHSEGDGLSGLVVDRFGDDARDGVLRRRHVPASARRSRTRCSEHFPGQPVLLVRRGARRQAGVVRLPAAGAAAAGRRSPSTALRFRVAPGSKHKTGLLPRPARQPPDARRVLRRQAGARPVLQHRRVRRLRQGARRGGGGGRRGPRRAGASSWRSRTPT